MPPYCCTTATTTRERLDWLEPFLLLHDPVACAFKVLKQGYIYIHISHPIKTTNLKLKHVIGVLV